MAELEKLNIQTDTMKESKAQYGTAADIPTGFKVDYRYTEKMSKRLNLLLRPSLHEAVKKAAQLENLSVNAYINAKLEKAADKTFKQARKEMAALEANKQE